MGAQSLCGVFAATPRGGVSSTCSALKLAQPQIHSKGGPGARTQGGNDVAMVLSRPVHGPSHREKAASSRLLALGKRAFRLLVGSENGLEVWTQPGAEQLPTSVGLSLSSAPSVPWGCLQRNAMRWFEVRIHP